MVVAIGQSTDASWGLAWTMTMMWLDQRYLVGDKRWADCDPLKFASNVFESVHASRQNA